MGPKSPAEAPTLLARVFLLREALLAAQAHLDYCGYGDKWERECAEYSKLPEKIQLALDAAEPAPARCTCLTELEEDAYGPGGPMSGRPKPPPCAAHPQLGPRVPRHCPYDETTLRRDVETPGRDICPVCHSVFEVPAP